MSKTVPIVIVIAIIVVILGVLTLSGSFTAVNKENSNNSTVNNDTQATVVIENGTFNPQNLTVKSGTTVTWKVNEASGKYMITSNKTGNQEGYLFMSDDLTNGQTFNYTFNGNGTYDYYDMDNMDNMNLTGTITVQ
jgi:plastocyanin